MNPKQARAGFYVLGGTLTRDAPSYVMRDADLDLHAALARGEFCYVLTSRQMGKSSLMVRTVVRLRDEGAKAVVIDLTALGQNLTPKQWYLGLLGRIGSQLEIDDEMEAYWYAHSALGPLQRWLGAIREVVLPHTEVPVFLFIDEIDATRSLPFAADEFFAGIRELYNERSEIPALSRLTFCLLGVATPADLIRDARTTPFNIGHRIELTDFTQQEAYVLLPGLRRAGGNAPAVLAKILHWTGGHPYLTQRLCQAVVEDHRVRSPAGVDRVCEDIFLSNKARERDDNLLFVRDRLLRGGADPVQLLSIYSNIWAGRLVKDDPSHPLQNELRLTGLVRSEDGYLRVRNRIYERVFNQKFVEANQPQDEVARQRAAERRGRLKVLSWAVPIVFAFAALAMLAWWQSRRAQSETENFHTTANTGMAAISSTADRIYDMSAKRPELRAVYAQIVEGSNTFLDTMLKIEKNNPAANNLKANSLYVAIDDAIRRGDKATAQSNSRECVTRAKALQGNSDIRVRAIAGRLYAIAAEAFGKLGDSAEAERDAQNAEALGRDVSSKVKPDDQFTLQTLSTTFNMLGSAEQSMDHWDRAVQFYQQNVGMDQKASDLSRKRGGPRNFDAVRDALEQRNRIAQIEFDNHHYDAARKVLEERSLAIAQTLVKWNDDPSEQRSAAQKLEARQDLFEVEDKLGVVLAARSATWPDALKYDLQALDDAEKLVQADPSLANVERRETAALAVARMRKFGGQASEAMDAYNKYLALLHQRAVSQPSSESATKLGFAYQELAAFEAHHGNKSAAPADYLNALDWLSKVSSSDGSVERAIAAVYLKLADVQSGFDQEGPARETYAKAARASEKCIAFDSRHGASEDAGGQAVLMSDYENLVFSKLGLGDRKGAADAVAKLLDRAKAEAAAAQASLDKKAASEAVDRAVFAYGTLGWAELLGNHPQESINASRSALKLADEKPSWIQANLAHAYLLAGQVDQASSIYAAHVGEPMYDDRFEISVLDDFAQLRRLGFDRPAIAQMEKMLGH
ncbi:MAG TPA: AAA-like domain-containing protein [Bryobacteraceae bacterium]|nr:AAA-like domain-containing protein [Bryobacteraceae bacterium]